MSQAPAVAIAVARRGGADAILLAFITTPPMPLMQKRANSEYGLKVLVPVNERHQKAVEYRSYSLVRRKQRYKDDVASEIKKSRKKEATN